MKRNEQEILQLERLVYLFAHRNKDLLNAVVDFEDLVQEAWLAVVTARKKFDERKGVKFIVYAFSAIRNRFRDLRKKKVDCVKYFEDIAGEQEGDRRVEVEELVKEEGRQEEQVFLKEVLGKLSVRGRLIAYEILQDGDVGDVKEYWKRLERKLGISLEGVLEEIREQLIGCML